MSIYTFPTSRNLDASVMRRDVNRFMNDVFGPVNDGSRWSPAADVTEDGTGFSIVLEVPGTKPENIEIVTEDNMLVVKGEKPHTALAEDATQVMSERLYGLFERRFRLPKNADLGATQASYNHGTLTVRVAKIPPVQPRRVEISVNDGGQ